MSTIEPTTGTTLEILAPFLPYGIEVEMLWFPLDEDRHTLRGLDSKTALPVLLGDADQGKRCGLGACLPVLRSFADLCTPLPDGTVPAVEVAKMAIGSPHFVGYEKPNPRFSGDSLMVSFGVMSTPCLIVGNGKWSMGWADADGNLNPCLNQLDILDYLRRNHFAVGLSPDQYIKKDA